MDTIEFENFKEDCLVKKCNRHTFISNTCKTEHKINRCYQKYLIQQEKNKIKQQNNILKHQEKVQSKLQEKVDEWEERKRQFTAGDLDTLYDVTDKLDLKLLEAYKQVDERDKFQCVVWSSILSMEEQKYILENFYESFKFLNKFIDHTHIEAISNKLSEKYNVDNIVLMSRFFHQRFDDYQNIVTGESWGKEGKLEFGLRLKEYINNIK